MQAYQDKADFKTAHVWVDWDSIGARIVELAERATELHVNLLGTYDHPVAAEQHSSSDVLSAVRWRG